MTRVHEEYGTCCENDNQGEHQDLQGRACGRSKEWLLITFYRVAVQLDELSGHTLGKRGKSYCVTV